MNPEAVALFRDLADRSPAEREEYHVRQKVPAAVRDEVERCCASTPTPSIPSSSASPPRRT